MFSSKPFLVKKSFERDIDIATADLRFRRAKLLFSPYSVRSSHARNFRRMYLQRSPKIMEEMAMKASSLRLTIFRKFLWNLLFNGYETSPRTPRKSMYRQHLITVSPF